MPRLRKCFVHGSVVEICSRVEEGLPFVSTVYMNVILLSILARAQTLFPCTICHFVFMGNHFHLIAVIKDPEMFDDFVAFFKRETAHAINRLLGRRQRTVWCDGYDSVIILDPEKVLQRIEYLYTNPSRANLVERIEDYPGVNSWHAFLVGGTTIPMRWIPRPIIAPLPHRTLSLEEQQRLADIFQEQATEESQLSIEPDAWLECFAETRGVDSSAIIQEIFRRIRSTEDRLKRSRTLPVKGAHALRLENMRREFAPRKYSRRMICFASLRAVRIQFVSWYRELCEEAAKICWKQERSRSSRNILLPHQLLQTPRH